MLTPISCRPPSRSAATRPARCTLPIVGNVEMFAYRKDLLAKYKLQPPRNWDDVLKIAQTVGGADKSVSGVVFRGTKGNPVVTGFLPILGLRRRRVRPCRQRDDRFA